YDVEFMPSNSLNIYAAADYGTVYYSSDGGSTWNVIAQLGASTGRVSIAVTPANPNYVYVWAVGSGLYKSTNGGGTFSPVTDPSFDAGAYGYYDMVLNVSAANANTVYAGGLNLVRSTDGGFNWTVVGDWQNMGYPNYLHADQHDIAFIPSSG